MNSVRFGLEELTQPSLLSTHRRKAVARARRKALAKTRLVRGRGRRGRNGGHRNDAKCFINLCKCSHGTGCKGGACPAHGVTKCCGCSSGYNLSGGKCNPGTKAKGKRRGKAKGKR